MHRILIAMGCNQYDYCNSLDGAELDARRIFDTLTRREIGNYDPIRSKLLLSPTLQQTEDTLNDALFSSGKIDTLTFYFAGHGAYRAASFFMCVRDSHPDKLSATALPLADLFMKMGEAVPAHTDIIIDACFSGGLISDLSVLLKPELMGDAGTPSVTLLAMSARNQTSLEDADGGQATNALLDCVVGSMFVHDSTAWLDLTDIGKKVSERIGEQVQQTPVVWGLNLNVQSAFCKNPHHQSKVDTTFTKWSPRSFFDAIEPIVRAHASVPREQVNDVERLTSGLLERAANSTDSFHQIQVEATAIASLLEYCGTSPKLDKYVSELSLRAARDTQAAITKACIAVETDRFALLVGGLADLFYLPLRLSKMLGWIGAAFHVMSAFGQANDFEKALFERFVGLLIEHYTTSISSMSDMQAPYMACALSAMHALGMDYHGEMVASLMFASAVECSGNVANCHLDPDKVLPYLIQRRNKAYASNQNFIARPSELLTVLLKSARLFSLEETFDYELLAFDHVTINAYVPDDYRLFAQDSISGGTNACYLIGNDIWTISELERSWPAYANNRPANPPVVAGAILSSLLFNDRVPWFLFSGV